MSEITPMSQITLTHEAKGEAENSLIVLGMIGAGMILILLLLAISDFEQIRMSFRLIGASGISIGFVLLYIAAWKSFRKLQKVARDTTRLYSNESACRGWDDFNRRLDSM